MRTIRSFGYHIAQGFKSIFRNSVMSLASIFVLVSCMLILGTFYLIITNIEENFNSIDNLNVIEVRMPSAYSAEQIEEIGSSLTDICEKSPIIQENPKFISSAEHLERFHKMYGDQSWSTFFNEDMNPLRSSYELTFTNFSDITEVVRIVTQIEGIKLSDGTVAVAATDIKSCIDVYRNVMGIKKTLYTVGLFMMVILLIVSLFVIVNTIKLGIFARKNEIMFMRFCGATKTFIRTPFLIEGCIIGLFSAALAIGLEYLVYTYALSGVVQSATAVISGGSIMISPYLSHIKVISIAFAAMGLFAGLISGTISLKNYLKV